MADHFQRHLSDARRRLMRPDRQYLDDGDLAEYCVETIDELITSLQLTNEPWFLQSAPIGTSPGVAVYSLDVRGFSGKPWYLWLEDLSDPSRPQRIPIPLVSPQELTENYGGGDGVPTVPGQSFSAAPLAAAISYSQDALGGSVIEFASIPQSAQRFRLTWEPATVRPSDSPGGMNDQGFRLNQFDNYVAALTALRALPHAGWKGLSEELSDKRYAKIEKTCLFDIGSVQTRRGYAWLFWCFKQSARQMNQPTQTGWAQNRM